MAANAPEQPACQLYLISPTDITDIGTFCDRLEAVLSAAPVAVFQLRLKGVASDVVADVAKYCLPICARHDTMFIVNDSPELARQVGADGVHLGEDDMPVARARALLGEDSIIGASAYDSMARAMELGNAGADYVAFGAFFSSQTKANTRQAGFELLEQWSEQATIACVAIGGIGAGNAHEVAYAGADYVAVSHAIWGADDAAKAAKDIVSAIALSR